MRWWTGLVVCVLGAGLAGSTLRQSVAAQETGKQRREELQQFHDQLARDVSTAAEMAEIGRRDGAPEALLAAAGLLLKVQAYTGGKLDQLKPQDFEVENDEKSPPEADSTFKDQAEALLEEVRSQEVRLPGDGNLIKAVRSRDFTRTADYRRFRQLQEEEKKFAGRGAMGGPKRITRKIPAGGHHTYTIRFQGGRPAFVAFQSSNPARFRVHTAGRGDLTNMVATISRYNWIPGKPMTVKVHIQGMGRMAQYTLITN